MSSARTILLIDDDVDILDGLQFILERDGYQILTAKSAPQGLQLFYKACPDLVISDMMMPNGSGFIVLQTIKEQFGESFPIIMLTAHAREEQIHYAESLGVDAFLRKPLASEQILQHVRRLCPLPIGTRNQPIAK